MKFNNICWLTIICSVIFLASSKSTSGSHKQESHVTQDVSSSNVAPWFLKNDPAEATQLAIGSTRRLLAWGWVIKAGKWVLCAYRNRRHLKCWVNWVWTGIKCLFNGGLRCRWVKVFWFVKRPVCKWRCKQKKCQWRWIKSCIRRRRMPEENESNAGEAPIHDDETLVDVIEKEDGSAVDMVFKSGQGQFSNEDTAHWGTELDEDEMKAGKQCTPATIAGWNKMADKNGFKGASADEVAKHLCSADCQEGTADKMNSKRCRGAELAACKQHFLDKSARSTAACCAMLKSGQAEEFLFRIRKFCAVHKGLQPVTKEEFCDCARQDDDGMSAHCLNKILDGCRKGFGSRNLCLRLRHAKNKRQFTQLANNLCPEDEDEDHDTVSTTTIVGVAGISFVGIGLVFVVFGHRRRAKQQEYSQLVAEEC